MTDIRTMTAGELANLITNHYCDPKLCDRCEAAAELERRAGLFERLESATADRWYFNLVRTPDGTWVAQYGAGVEVECPTARAAVEAALQEPQP